MTILSILRSTTPASLLALAAVGHAGVLNPAPLTTTVGNGVASASAITTATNNYPTANAANNLAAAVTLNAGLSPLDLVLSGINSTGTTQYRATVTLGNVTGSTLSSYSFQLGTGTGAGFVPFTGTGASTGVVSFLPTTPAPSSPTFPTFVQSNSLLTFSGGTLANNGTTTFNFNLAVPDFAASPFSFTLRQTPQVVPEPSALAALGIGAVALFKRRERA